MRGVVTVLMALAGLLVFLATSWLHFPWEVVITGGLAALCLAWLVIVLTLPWNVYFQAKATLFEMQRARERGIAVREDREAEARRVERRMLRASIAMHVGSALVAAVITAVSHARWGYVFSASYLVSGFFRPGFEYYRYLRQRLGHLVKEVSFPREDVVALKAEVVALQERAKMADAAETALRERIAEVQQAGDTRHRELERRFVSLARTFEETVDRLTDNQQIIGGLKAFLRLIQQGSAGAATAEAAPSPP